MSDPAHLRKQISGVFEDASALQGKADGKYPAQTATPADQLSVDPSGQQSRAPFIWLAAGAAVVSALPFVWSGLAGWSLSLASLATLGAVAFGFPRAESLCQNLK